MRARRRGTGGFNLSFLDIMACGLGAVILIFMLVKDQAKAPSAELETLRADLSELRNELQGLESAVRALNENIGARKRELRERMARAEEEDAQSANAAGEIIELARQIASLQREKSRLQQLAPKDSAPLAGGGEEHLLGLRVEGSFIIILLDSSASMAAERLVEIIQYKVRAPAVRRAAPKWRRALAAARWVAERVPENSRYRVIHYNDDATLLGEKWLRGGDAGDREKLFAELEKLDPHGATNLHRALRAVTLRKLKPSDIYVITDSLPTKGELSAVQRFRDCGGNAATVSGRCRMALMYAAIKSFSGNARVHTLLLPVEGDPDAAYAYWAWSASTTGVMVGPEQQWP